MFALGGEQYGKDKQNACSTEVIMSVGSTVHPKSKQSKQQKQVVNAHWI